MDFAAGFAAGFAMAKKKFEGSGGGGDEPEHDSDYQKWLDLPEPNDNQAVFLIRITDKYHYVVFAVQLTGDDAYYTIDWGDGSDIETLGHSHTYDAPGEYVVIFTSVNAVKARVITGQDTTLLIMAKYGNNTYIDNLSTGYTISNQKHLRYIRLSPITVFCKSFFENCYALREIEFDGAITELYPKMFKGCYTLVFDTLKFENILSVPEGAFLYCWALSKIPVPNCTSIGTRAFSGCLALKTVSLPNCTTIGDESFLNCVGLENISLPNCTSIGNYSFSGCSTLKIVSLPNCTTLGSAAFQTCSVGLENISLPNCTSIGNYSFNSNSRLKTVSLPNCTTIGDESFYNCIALNELTVADDCTFGTDCFFNCYSLYPRPDGSSD